MPEPGLQDQLAPNNRCFGCGPANDEGLRIKSRRDGDGLVCTWQPARRHEAWSNMLNGGIVGTLFDCHSNWTAAVHLMDTRGTGELPSTVTAEFHVQLKRPTPTRKPVTIRARVVESADPKVVVEAELEAEGKVTATCRGVFVAVEEGHPAWHRW